MEQLTNNVPRLSLCACRALRSGYSDLVPQCVQGVDVNGVTQGGDTALHWAVSERHVAVVRLLLQHSADVLIANQRGDTAASLARAAGGELERLVGEREEAQRRQQQEQRQSEASQPMSTFAVATTAAADSSAGPKKKMTIKLKPKK